MALAVSQFLGIIGLDMEPPTDMATLIPYLLTLVVGMFLVSLVFKVLVGLVRGFISMRRF